MAGHHTAAPTEDDVFAAAPPIDDPLTTEEADSTSRNFDRLESYLVSPAGRKLAAGLKSLFVIVTIVLLSIQQVQFRDTWSRECDYNIKVWSTVWLSRALIQHIIVWIGSIQVVTNRMNRGVSITLRKFQSLIFIFKFCWFLYGIKPVLVDEHCNYTSKTWGLVLWWLEFSLTVAPCVCVCLLCPFIICCFWGEIPPSEDHPEPTPEDVRNRLKQVMYCDISDELESRQREVPTADPQVVEATEGGIFPEISSLTGVPIPDISQLRRLQSGILGRQQSLPSHRPESGVLQMSASIVGNQQNVMTCPICFCNFEPKDEVVQMPCDFRHVFHSKCLFAWLEQSQQCPICRSNVVDALKRQEDEKRRQQSNSTEASNHSSLV